MHQKRRQFVSPTYYTPMGCWPFRREQISCDSCQPSFFGGARPKKVWRLLKGWWRGLRMRGRKVSERHRTHCRRQRNETLDYGSSSSIKIIESPYVVSYKRY